MSRKGHKREQLIPILTKSTRGMTAAQRLPAPSRLCPALHRPASSALSYRQTVWLLCPTAFVMLLHQQSLFSLLHGSPRCEHSRMGPPSVLGSDSWASRMGLLILRTDSVTSGKLLKVSVPGPSSVKVGLITAPISQARCHEYLRQRLTPSYPNPNAS